MKKILFLLHLPPPIHGSSMIGNIIRMSPIINNSFCCRYINLLASKSINDTGKFQLKKVVAYINTYLKLFNEIIFQKPKLCYFALTTTGLAFYKDVLLIIILKLFKVKVIYHLHNKGITNFSLTKFNALLYRFVFQGTYVILLSPLLYDDVKYFVPQSYIHICPNGIEDIGNDIPTNGLPNKAVTKILFFSNLIISKGVIILLDACQILAQKNIRFICEFVGGEGDFSVVQFEKIVIERKLQDKVKYLGKQFGEQKKHTFCNTDIFVLPSYNDCFPLVILEAMSASLPVISTFEGGIPDIVSDGITGILLPHKNASALAHKLELLINNPQLRKTMGENGRKKYKEHYTLKKFENNFIKILNEI